MQLDLLQTDYSEGNSLDALGLVRYCCWRMQMIRVNLFKKLLSYNILEKPEDSLWVSDVSKFIILNLGCYLLDHCL